MNVIKADIEKLKRSEKHYEKWLSELRNKRFDRSCNRKKELYSHLSWERSSFQSYNFSNHFKNDSSREFANYNRIHKSHDKKTELIFDRSKKWEDSFDRFKESSERFRNCDRFY